MAALNHLLDFVAPFAFPLGLVALAVAVVWLIRHHPVGAVIRNTIAQAVRIKAAFAIMALYLVLIVVIPFAVKGDGTLAGQLHVVIAYAFIAAGILLGLLTLAMSTTTLWSELHEKQIYLLESKPVRRWQILLGKLLGILTINAVLLLFMGLVTWGCVKVLASAWKGAPTQRLSPREIQFQRFEANDHVLVARRLVPPVPVDLSKDVADAYERLKERGKLPEGKTEAEVKEQLEDELRALVNALPPRDHRHWRFEGLKFARRPGKTITLRFKFACSDRSLGGNAQVGWEIGDPKTSYYVRSAGAYKPDEVHEESISADFITAEGTLDVRLYNLHPKPVILVFTGDDAMQVLVPMAGFASNLSRGLWLVFVEVLFLAVLGLTCSTFLSFPVSPVVALSVYVLIFLASAMDRELSQGLSLFENKEKSAAVGVAEHAVRGVVAAIRHVLPPLDRYSASERVSSGVEVSWFLLLDATFWIALLRGGLLFLLGALVFQRRELALASR